MKQYAESASNTVYGTARKDPSSNEKNVKWIDGVDIGTEQAGKTIASKYEEKVPIDTVIITAGYFGKESFDTPDWEAELTMYKTNAIGPSFSYIISSKPICSNKAQKSYS